MKSKIIKISKLCSHGSNSFCKRALFTIAELLKLNNQFNCLNTQRDQNIFLSQFLKAASSKTNKSIVTEYFILKSDGVSHNICLNSFMAIFSISRDRLSNIKRKLIKNQLNLKDCRGGARTTDDIKKTQNSIREHIGLQEFKISHYNREKDPVNRKYLPSHLSIMEIYKEFCKTNMTTYYQYKNIFQKEFDIKFSKPKIDICDYCLHYYNSEKTGISKNKAEEKNSFLKHLNDANYFYSELNTKTKENEIKISFDLMKMLPLPFVRNNKAYYSRSIWLYSSGIVEKNYAGKETTYFYNWTEWDGKKGSNEVTSILYTHLLKIIGTYKKIFLYCDNCGGQNKNIILFSMLLFLSSKFKVYIKILYPVRGHSFLPSDRSFGRVEQKRKNIDMIMTVSEYTKLFQRVGEVNIAGENFFFSDWKIFIK